MAFLPLWHSNTRNEVGLAYTADDRRKAETRGFFSFIVFSMESYFAVYDRFSHFTPDIEELTTNFASEPVFVPLLLKGHMLLANVLLSCYTPVRNTGS